MSEAVPSLADMDIILIPGLWLDGSSWDQVVPALQHAGHRTHALTLPGMETKTSDRSGITLRDHVDAVVAVIDSLDRDDGQVVLVGHAMLVTVVAVVIVVGHAHSSMSRYSLPPSMRTGNDCWSPW